MKSYRDWTVEKCIQAVGTGHYVLDGAPVGTSYFTFRQRYANGESTVCYFVRNRDRSKWEKNHMCTLTYGSSSGLDELSRNVVESTNGDAPIVWNSGDLPLTIYVVADSDAMEGAITGWLAPVRHALRRFGTWFKQDNPATGEHTWKIFDGTADIDLGIVDTSNHTIEMACMPAGAVMAFAGSSAPAGFLLCHGQAVSRDTYARLFDAIGTAFGAGDGSTTFNVPDLGGRVVAGKEVSATRLTTGGSGIDGDTLGATGGVQTVGLVATNLPELLLPAGTGVPGSQTPRAVFGDGTNAGTIPVAGTNPGSTGLPIQNTQPTLILNYLISTGGA